MRNQNSFEPSAAAAFEGVQNVGHMNAVYVGLLDDVTTNHANRLGQLSAAHRASFIIKDQLKDLSDVGDLLASSREGFRRAFTAMTQNVSGVMGAVADIAPDMLSAKDGLLLETAKDAVQQGYPAERVRGLISAADNRRSRKVMRLGLDHTVLEVAHNSLPAVESSERYKLLDCASSSLARKIIGVSLESSLVLDIDAATSEYGLGVTHRLAGNLPKTIKKALFCMSDSVVFETVQQLADKDRSDFADILRYASSPFVRRVIERSFREYPVEQLEAQDPEVDRIIEAAIQKSPRSEWLRRANQGDIRRVVNTVRSARQKAEDGGKVISDQDLFRRYHASVNKPPGPDGSNVDPRLATSFAIFEALMGSFRGELPF